MTSVSALGGGADDDGDAATGLVDDDAGDLVALLVARATGTRRSLASAMMPWMPSETLEVDEPAQHRFVDLWLSSVKGVTMTV